MNIINKIWDYLRQTNKVHPFCSIVCKGGDLSMKGCTIKLGCEINVNKGSLKMSEVWIDRFVRINTRNFISIGKGTTVNMCSKIYGDVTIGDNCLIAPNVFISSTEHMFRYIQGLSIRDQEKKYLEEHDSLPSKQIKISDDVWLSANTVVIPGVSICSHVVIGANSVVTRDILESGVYVGSPARKIRDL